METERPHHHHHHHNSTSELFICFTSMKLSSKSILSPSRNREPSQISLSSSLSRRLRSNGSINGQASPMFPTTNGKKRGCGFENPEPSSPKVTCIGQVRVKTKKQGKKMRAARSKKRRGEASFRRTEQGGFSDLQNLQQENRARWVHLPLTICEALRTFGAEFSCLFPCGREKEKGEGSGGAQSREGSCGAAFARWLVALQEGDGKGREIEIVVGEQNQLNEHGEKEEEEEDDDDDRPERSRRRHVFEDIEIDVEKNEEEEEEKGRVSICIPPKNALLLMRCRSDPVKMAALANRFWESPAHTHQDEENEQEDEEEQREVHMEEDEQVQVQVKVQVPEVEQDDRICEEQEISEIEANPEPEVEQDYEAEAEATPNAEINEDNQQEKERTEEEEDDEGGNANAHANQKDETLVSISSPEVEADLEKSELVDVQQEKLEKENQDCNIQPKSSELESSEASESENNEEESVKAETFAEETETEESTGEDEEEEEEEEEKETKEKPRDDETTATQERSEPDDDPKLKKPGQVLPDCLLLMMCEPKLSMEVSKETWVCSTDFIRWLPERPAKRTNGGDEPKKRISVDSKPPLPAPAAAAQPPRSSCSFPAPATQMSMATMIEQKLVGSNGYEPFVLTRCKSEPMRSSDKFAQPDACFWKNRKLEPHHRPARLGVGAAGVGF